MAFDGASWNEAAPTNNDLANEIDDYMRDDKIAVRGRLAHEHIWAASQSATNEAGLHKFVTFQQQTAQPALVVGTNTQIGAVYMHTNKHMTFVDSAGTEFIVFKSAAGVCIQDGTGNIGDIPVVTSSGGLVAIAASDTNFVLTAQGTTAAPVWLAAPKTTFAAWVSTAVNATITATGDIVVCAYVKSSGGIVLEGQSPAGTTRVIASATSGNPNVGVTFPVRSGDTFTVVTTGSPTESGVSYLPLGT